MLWKTKQSHCIKLLNYLKKHVYTSLILVHHNCGSLLQKINASKIPSSKDTVCSYKLSVPANKTSQISPRQSSRARTLMYFHSFHPYSYLCLNIVLNKTFLKKTHMLKTLFSPEHTFPSKLRHRQIWDWYTPFIWKYI